MIEMSEFDDFQYVHGAAGIETLETLRQRLAYDMIPDDLLDSYAERIGLSPVSPEVSRAEHAASRVRRAATATLVPLMLDMATLSSEVLAEAILVKHEEPDDEPVHGLSANQIFVTTNAILATLIDMGLVHLPHPTGDHS